MNLLSGIDTLLYPKQTYGKNCIEITPIGGNIRYIDLTRPTLAEIDNWVVRLVKEELVASLAEVNQFNVASVADADKLRLGEIIHLLDNAGDFIGTAHIQSIIGTIITYLPGGGIAFDATAANVTTVVLEADPILLDERSKPIASSKLPYFIVQADAGLELSISILHNGLEN